MISTRQNKFAWSPFCVWFYVNHHIPYQQPNNRLHTLLWAFINHKNMTTNSLNKILEYFSLIELLIFYYVDFLIFIFCTHVIHSYVATKNWIFIINSTKDIFQLFSASFSLLSLMKRNFVVFLKAFLCVEFTGE